MNYQFLNSKKIRELFKQLNQNYGDITLDYLFLKTNTGRIYILNKTYLDYDLSNLKIDSLGLYVINVKDELRLTIEGSQLIGPQATKNVLEINEDQLKKWMSGEDLLISKDNSDCFLIVKCGQDYLGSGKLIDGKLLNYIPKTRRINI